MPKTRKAKAKRETDPAPVINLNPAPCLGQDALDRAASRYLHNIVHLATETAEILATPARLQKPGETLLASNSCQALRRSLGPLVGWRFDPDVLCWPGVKPISLLSTFTRQMRRIARRMDDAAKRIENALARKRRPSVQPVTDLQDAADRLRQAAAPYGVDPFAKAEAVSHKPPEPAGGETRQGSDMPPVPDALVTLDQAAALVQQSKRTLERYLQRGDLPTPDVPGGSGKPHRWYWSKIRPALCQHFRPDLPEKAPTSRIL